MELKNESFLVPAQFYGPELCRKVKDFVENNRGKASYSVSNSFVPFDLQRLLGPTSTWKVFKKQIEALTFVKCNKTGMMAFVFQQTDGVRLFLAAHPRWLWYYDSKKDPSLRCSYEIIPEYTVCKLYFDLEFDISVNKSHNGVLMVETFIKIINFFIKVKWNLDVDRRFIIDLDSSTALKFSRHLIFNLPFAAFRDNYNVGNFVKYVCKEIKSCIQCLEEDSNYCNDFMKGCGLEGSSVKLLKVTDSKGKSIIFCDEGVYTKNRHFRLFKSTKLGKNAPLLLSTENVYKPNNLSLKNIEEQIFLDSLVTYIPNDDVKILQFIDSTLSENLNDSTPSSTRIVGSNALHGNCCKSPFPKIDKFIEKLVYPGCIWRSNYFQTSNIIVYDIIGNRYCGNIGRQHRSNNIKQIVDLSNHCFYQKCYDPDCFNYRSEPSKLPPEIQFFLEDEFDSFILESDASFESQLNSSFDDCLNDKELAEVVDVVEQLESSLPLED